MRPSLVVPLLLAGVLAAAPTRAADAPTLADPGWMSGQPPRWRVTLGSMAGHDGHVRQATLRGFLDAENRIAMPQFGLVDAHFEGAVDAREGRIGASAGVFAKLPYVRVGVERDFDDRRFDLVLSLQGSLRRGGLFRRGERLRLDWSPTRPSLQAGLLFNPPWVRYRRTRPYRTHFDLPRGRATRPSPADAARVESPALARVEHAIDWLDRLLTPHLAPDGFSSPAGERRFAAAFDELRAHAREEGHDFAGEDSAYHAGLDLAFAHAAGGDAATGRLLAAIAERTIFETIVVPVNRRFGTRRHRPGIGGLADSAQVRFAAALARRTPALDAAGAADAAAVFRRVVARIDAAARASGKRWGNDESLVWLPLNYGLRPGQYDTSDELEGVIGGVLGREFSRGNTIRSVMNDRFVDELRRMILETRDYHVLWVHDFRGRNAHGKPDRVAWSQAIGGYALALTRAVEAMDRGERADLPVFLLFLDEHYYQVNRSRSIVSLLEHPLTGSSPETGDPALDGSLERGLSRLREVVRASPALARLGPDYVARRLRVQVHVTYPLDPAFAGDILMRDHRKIAFRDVIDDEPGSGTGIVTGEGVGEHYQGPHWEDRSLVVQGAELVHLRAAARRLLLSQGFGERELPGALRASVWAGRPSGTAQLAEAGRGDPEARLLAAFNDTGWGGKPATVLKAILYNLALPGGCMIAPDSLWTSDFWAGMFVMAALRGCRMIAIAPAGEHAPSNSLPTLGLMHETLALLWSASERMAPDLARRGGALRVGLYTRDGDVNDMRALVADLRAAGSTGALPLSELRLDPAIGRALAAEADTLARDYAGPRHPFDRPAPGRPQIHLKAQFYVSPAALDLFERPDWGPIVARYLAIRRRQTLDPADDAGGITAGLLRPAEAPGAVDANILSVFRDSLRAAGDPNPDRAFCVAIVGSHNQDRRSMLLDGEVLVAVSGAAALTTAIDFGCLVATATWPASRAELDARFPRSDGVMKRFRRWIRNLI